MNVERISIAQLAALLTDEKAVNGCTFASFNALTEPDMNKTINGDRKNPNPHYGKIRKVLDNQLVMLFSNKTTNAYENMVNRRLVLDGKAADFQVSKRSWGTRIPNTSVVEHTNKAGEYCQYLSVIYHENPVSLMQYVADLGLTFGPADAELVEAMKQKTVAFASNSGEVSYVIANDKGGWDPIAKDAIIGLVEKETEGKQGGLSEGMKVVPRDFKMRSIQQIRFGGNTYIIDGN